MNWVKKLASVRVTVITMAATLVVGTSVEEQAVALAETTEVSAEEEILVEEQVAALVAIVEVEVSVVTITAEAAILVEEQVVISS
jgi:hypothetical protein